MSTIEVICPKCGNTRSKSKRRGKQSLEQVCRSCARSGLKYNVDSKVCSKIQRDRFEASKNYGDLPEWVTNTFGKQYNEISTCDKVEILCLCGRRKVLLAKSCLPKYGISERRRCRSCLNTIQKSGKKLPEAVIDKLRPTFFGKQAKHYIITHPVTEEPIIVQGSYELAYACYLLANKVEFESHRSKLPYFDEEGTQREYRPDFYVPSLDIYVEIKSDYTLGIPGVKQKYAAIKALGHNLLVLSNSQLEKLGVL